MATEAMSTEIRCQACGELKPHEEMANRHDHNTGGQVQCLDCHQKVMDHPYLRGSCPACERLASREETMCANGRETISEAVHRRVRESSGTKVRFVIAIDGEIARSRAAEMEPEEFQEWLRSRACFMDV